MLERFLPDSNSKFDYASSFDVFCASSWSFMCVVVVRKLRPQYLAPIEVLSNDIIVGICWLCHIKIGCVATNVYTYKHTA